MAVSVGHCYLVVRNSLEVLGVAAEKAVCVALRVARGTFSTARRNGLQRACPTSAAATAAVVGKTTGRLCVVVTDVLSRHGVGYDLGVRASPMQRMRAMQYSSCTQYSFARRTVIG